MNFNDSFAFDTYSNDAGKQFDEMQNRLISIESNFQVQMNGKTSFGLIASFIGTIIWACLFVAVSFYIRGMVEPTIFKITIIVVMGLILSMLADGSMNLLYYEKINSYKIRIRQLHDRVSREKELIKENNAMFQKSRNGKWEYNLIPGSSVPEEAMNIERTMVQMKALDSGLINGAKNIFFYLAAVMVTVLGSVALFDIAGTMILNITDAAMEPGIVSSDMLNIFSIIGMVITVVVEVILSKWIWSCTNCSVTNITLLVSVVGPIIFLILMAVATILVVLVVYVAIILIVIAALAAGIACLVGMLSGG